MNATDQPSRPAGPKPTVVLVQAALLAATQRPVAAAAFSDVSGPPAWKKLPCRAVVATGDKAAGTDITRSLAQRAAYRDKFAGRYEHRTITGGIGHNLPHEAPQAFTHAVIDAASY